MLYMAILVDSLLRYREEDNKDPEFEQVEDEINHYGLKAAFRLKPTKKNDWKSFNTKLIIVMVRMVVVMG